MRTRGQWCGLLGRVFPSGYHVCARCMRASLNRPAQEIVGPSWPLGLLRGSRNNYPHRMRWRRVRSLLCDGEEKMTSWVYKEEGVGQCRMRTPADRRGLPVGTQISSEPPGPRVGCLGGPRRIRPIWPRGAFPFLFFSFLSLFFFYSSFNIYFPLLF